ncbi:MAG: M14 family zinc carboxypeptidase [Lachnospiraceae bacterium]|nr:M14 family zinc carboxypeptidase [Lachnospiraceae bacterium]
MKQRWMLLFFCMTGLLFAFACGRKVPEAPESATTLTLFPTITQAPSPVPTAVEPTLSPVPSVLIPDDIVDTGKEPYTYDEMCEDLELLAYAYPDIISLSWEGKSADGRRIPAVLFGNPEAEHTLFIQAAIHGREHLTTLLVMEQLETYAREYDTGSYSGRTYREIFSDVALLVVPMTNPDGVSISQLGTESIETEELRALVEGFYERDGAGMTREYFYRRYKANANGVDLNRNFAYGFEEFVGNAVPAADRYKGEAPASEPETRYLMELTESRQTAAALSYHATGSVLYWDFGQTGAFREKCLSFVNVVHELTGYRIVYSASEKQDAAGYCEWAAGIKGIPEVTIEIGTVAAPLPISQFENIWLENRDVPAAVAVQVQKLYENAE